jgi:hypothetical protein
VNLSVDLPRQKAQDARKALNWDKISLSYCGDGPRMEDEGKVIP